MPRRISLQVLTQTALIYAAVRTQDTTGGVQYSYPAITGEMKCTSQPREYEELYENDRITQQRHWVLMFASDPLVSPRDMIVWTDAAKLTHTGFVQTSRDEAGRGIAYSVRVIEKL